MFHEVNLYLPRVIIDKGNKIQWTIKRRHNSWIPYISMHKL